MNNLRSLLCEAGDSAGSLNTLDNIEDIDNYEDCRLELRSHNLVSFLLIEINY